MIVVVVMAMLNGMDGQNTNRPMGGSMKDKTFILFFTGPFSVLAIMVILFCLFLYHITEGTNFLIMPSSLQLWGSICICCIADIIINVKFQKILRMKLGVMKRITGACFICVPYFIVTNLIPDKTTAMPIWSFLLVCVVFAAADGICLYRTRIGARLFHMRTRKRR